MLVCSASACTSTEPPSGTGGVGGSGGMAGSGGRGGTDAQAAIAAMIASVDSSRYEADLLAIARQRNHGSEAWQETQDRCADILEALGFDVELQAYGTGVNVIGTLPGLRQSQIILSAHYDAVPDCEGADDNASGVAGALEAARALVMNRYDRTLVVACWDEEELGLVGARTYANKAIAAGVDVVGMFSLEMIGYKSDEPNTQELPPGIDLLFPEPTAIVAANQFRGDFIAIVADERSRALNDAFQAHADTLGLPWIELEVPDALLNNPLAADLQRSDHAAFWQVGYSGIMLTDSANFRNLNYHCSGGPDTADRLNTNFAVGVIKSVVGAMATELGVRN